MPRVCFFTGRKTKVGRKIRYRGKPKYQGGIGLKITANDKRKFKPNLPNQINDVLKIATAKNPKERYEKMTDLAKAFRDAIPVIA